MSALVLTRRDIIFFKYLHACKVANTKQINRDIFRVGHRTCQYRLMKLSQKKFIEKMPSFKDEDKSFVFSLSSKGMKAVNVNFENLIHGKRYRSDSIEHDLPNVGLMRKRTTILRKCSFSMKLDDGYGTRPFGANHNLIQDFLTQRSVQVGRHLEKNSYYVDICSFFTPQTLMHNLKQVGDMATMDYLESFLGHQGSLSTYFRVLVSLFC